MAHKDEYGRNVKVLEKIIEVLPEDNKNRTFFSNYLDQMRKASADEKKMDESKWCFLETISNAAMHQAIYAAFRIGVLTDEIEKEWRENTRNLDDANADWKAITDAMEETKSNIDKQIAEFRRAEEDLGKFQSVATGRSKNYTEANQKAKEYNERAGQASQGV